MVWLGLGTKLTWLGLGKDMCLASQVLSQQTIRTKQPNLTLTNTAGNYYKVSIKHLALLTQTWLDLGLVLTEVGTPS